MSGGLENIREQMVDYLKEQGVQAFAAWPAGSAQFKKEHWSWCPSGDVRPVPPAFSTTWESGMTRGPACGRSCTAERLP